MFSWQNIKDTYEEKVKYGSGLDKVLGIAEVVGKSVVAGTTAVAKEIPDAIINQSEQNIRKANRALKNDSLDDDSRDRLEHHKVKMQEGIENMKGLKEKYSKKSDKE